MKRLSENAVEKEIISLDTSDDLVGTKPTATELAEKSLGQRQADAAAVYARSGWPTPLKPINTLADAIRAAHAKLAADNEERQKRLSPR